MSKANAAPSSASLYQDVLILVGIWSVCAVVDWIWLGLDRSEPAWDQGAHLVAAMHHWKFLQAPMALSKAWWTQLWSLSPNYRGPFVYGFTAPFLQVLGQHADAAIAVNQLFSALLLPAVYGLGRCLFNRSTGLWSAALCAIAPTLTFARLDYLLDYGITTVMVIAFTLLTFWWRDPKPARTWLWSLGFGGAIGGAILAKPTCLLFIALPIIWLLRRWVHLRQWLNGLQLVLALLFSGLLSSGWIGQNWLTIITSSLNSNAVGQREGDPSVMTVAGWLYYLQRLPNLVSWPFLVAAIAGAIVLLYAHRRTWKLTPEWTWLGSYAIGFYGLCTLATNKDLRFILPITPILIVIGVQWIQELPLRFKRGIHWGTVASSALLLIYALFPLPGSTQLSDRHLASPTPVWPVQEVVNTIYQASPYQVSTLGMLVDTPQIHAFNVDFYGTLANFQVLGRQLGFGKAFIEQDARSLTWYLAKTGDQGSWKEHPVITPLRQRVEADSNLAIYRAWPLPDQSELRLYRRQQPTVTVTPLPPSLQASRETDQPIQVTRVQAPAQATPGSPFPVVYELQGGWDALRAGILILTWQNMNGTDYWVQDHAIGLNELASDLKTPPDPGATIRETLATLPPASLPPGTYQLKAWYLDRQAQTATPLVVPTSQVELGRSSTTPTVIARDRVSLLRQFAQSLSKGQFDDVFKHVGPMNQYGSVQSYLQTAASAASYRLSQNQQDIESAYTLVLSQVLQRDAPAAIATLQHITQIDVQNPYAWAYLAFVYLYSGQPQPADTALAEVVRLNPNLPLLKTLQIASALMQGNLIRAAQFLN
jgi:4-amino-4-deoxy-L-arabinose transferase-like glycosyltransferase